jgi:hypothetical protein
VHGEDLIDNLVLLGLLVEVHLLDGHEEVCPAMLHGKHAFGRTKAKPVSTYVAAEHSDAPLANFYVVAIQPHQVCIGANCLESLPNLDLITSSPSCARPLPRRPWQAC